MGLHEINLRNEKIHKHIDVNARFYCRKLDYIWIQRIIVLMCKNLKLTAPQVTIGKLRTSTIRF
jgi:hypothetical protein